MLQMSDSKKQNLGATCGTWTGLVRLPFRNVSAGELGSGAKGSTGGIRAVHQADLHGYGWRKNGRRVTGDLSIRLGSFAAFACRAGLRPHLRPLVAVNSLKTLQVVYLLSLHCLWPLSAFSYRPAPHSPCPFSRHCRFPRAFCQGP